MDFLAFLVPKSWPKYCKLTRNSLPIPKGIPEIFRFFGHNFGPRKSIKGYKRLVL